MEACILLPRVEHTRLFCPTCPDEVEVEVEAYKEIPRLFAQPPFSGSLDISTKELVQA